MFTSSMPAPSQPCDAKPRNGSVLPSPNGHEVVSVPKSPSPLTRLRELGETQGSSSQTRKLRELEDLLADDMQGVEALLAVLPEKGTGIHRAALHLLRIPGKYVRPACVAMVARTAGDFDRRARDIAAAVELVHNATLLHDDVVDIGETRRGEPTSRKLFGNAAAVFAGDWLLVRALKLVHRVEMPSITLRLLDVIENMIEAESIQLAHRGSFSMDTAAYFRVIEGKTASLFAWSCYASASLAGHNDECIAALERFGRHLGIAFQLRDDALDYEGDRQLLGKETLQDLREGKTTYPLLLAKNDSPELCTLLCHAEDMLRAEAAPSEHGAQGATAQQAAAGQKPSHDWQTLSRDILRLLRASGAIEQCGELAESHALQAVDVLEHIPESTARNALQAMARALTVRES